MNGIRRTTALWMAILLLFCFAASAEETEPFLDNNPEMTEGDEAEAEQVTSLELDNTILPGTLSGQEEIKSTPEENGTDETAQPEKTLDPEETEEPETEEPKEPEAVGRETDEIIISPDETSADDHTETESAEGADTQEEIIPAGEETVAEESKAEDEITQSDESSEGRIAETESAEGADTQEEIIPAGEETVAEESKAEDEINQSDESSEGRIAETEGIEVTNNQEQIIPECEDPVSEESSTAIGITQTNEESKPSPSEEKNTKESNSQEESFQIPEETAPVQKEPDQITELPALEEPAVTVVMAEGTEEHSDVLAAAEDVLPASDYAKEHSVRGFVYRMYKVVLQREPDEEGFQFWVNLLESGTYSAADVVSGFFNSEEYQHSGKNNSEIVTDCYNTMLNRDPDGEGFQFWKQRLDIGMTSQSIIAGFVESEEFTKLASQYGVIRGEVTVSNPRDLNYQRTYFVYRLYQNCLGREPDIAGEEFWCENLEKGMSGAEIAGGFFFSDEFNKNRYNNSTFVQILYKTILGREYDTGGLVNWTTKLNYTESREKVLNGFIASEEFHSKCETAKINPGEPINTPDESVEWQYNIEVLRLCNEERREAGLPDLYTREDLLWDLAMERTEETTVQFSHTRPNGTSCFTLFTERGFYGYLGENLAAGASYSDPGKVVDAWMNSQGHRDNILNPKFSYVATGYIYNPDAETYCAEGKYKGNYVKFESYVAQSFCNYGLRIK